MTAIMSSRLAAELDHAFERNGWSAQEVKLLSSGSLLAEVRKVVLGQPEIKVVEHIIDCDANPFNPCYPWTNDAFIIEEHQKGGQWKFDPKQVEFFLPIGQKDGKVIERNELRKELAKKPVLNANVLDYLLEHPELIPDEWKTDGNGNNRCTFFWGTVYRHNEVGLCVRCLLCGKDGGWGWGRHWLDSGWAGCDSAAVRAS